jgi:hypothetical protein
MNLSGSAQYFLTPGELKKFTEALTQALYDHAVEEQRTVRYYYDADIVVWMVLGLFGDPPKYPTVKEDLVRALLSAGLLGEVHVLRPHAVELRNRIANVEENASRIRSLAEPGAFRQRIANYFGETKVNDEATILSSLDRLDEALSKARDRDERIETFLAEIKISGPQTFIAYEIARGNWEERLRTLRAKVLRFEEFGEDIEKILDENRDVWPINEAIVQARQKETEEQGGGRPRPTSLSDLSDAIAMATLSQMIAASATDENFHEVRFHTNTPRLVKAAGSPEIDKSFRYPATWEKEESWDTDLVFRGTEYYILRASFKALHFKGMSELSTGDEVTLAELEDVRLKLVSAWRQYEQPDDRADAERRLLANVEDIHIGSGTLRDALINLERASFLARLLKEYEVPTSVSSFLRERNTTDVFSAEETHLAAVRLLEEAKGLANDLTGKLTNIDRWFGPTREIILAVNRLSKSQDDSFAITDAVRDLGLVRWGADPDPTEIDIAMQKAQALFSKVDRHANRAASDLSREVEHPVLGESRALANAALLWQLGLFDLVIRLINRYQDRHGGPPLSLQIMRKAARLRSKHDSSTEENKVALGKLRDSIEHVAEPVTRGRYYLGLAYIAFYIAFRHEARDTPLAEAFDEHVPPDVREWAVESYGHAEKAKELLKSDPLARAFAINHAAYVGVLYHLNAQTTKRYLDELRELSRAKTPVGERRIWHYRFADTVAIASYRAGHDTWKATAADGEQGSPEEACRRLAEAQSILQTANPYLGDIDIPRHRREIAHLQRLVGCPTE